MSDEDCKNRDMYGISTATGFVVGGIGAVLIFSAACAPDKLEQVVDSVFNIEDEPKTAVINFDENTQVVGTLHEEGDVPEGQGSFTVGDNTYIFTPPQ